METIILKIPRSKAHYWIVYELSKNEVFPSPKSCTVTDMRYFDFIVWLKKPSERTEEISKKSIRSQKKIQREITFLPNWRISGVNELRII